MTRVRVRRRGDEAVLSFPYDRALVRAVKTLPRRRYDPAVREWAVPLRHYLDAVAALEGAGAEVDLDPALESLAEEGSLPPPEKPRVRVTKVGGDYVLRFPYRPALVRAVKGLPGRTFDPSSKAWFVPIEDPEFTLQAVVDTMEAAGAEVDLEEALRPLAAR